MGDIMVLITFLCSPGTIPDPRPPKTAPKITRLDNYRCQFCCRGLYLLPHAA